MATNATLLTPNPTTFIQVYDFDVINTEGTSPTKQTVDWIMKNERTILGLIKSKLKGVPLSVEECYFNFLSKMATFHEDFDQSYGIDDSYQIRMYVLARLDIEMKGLVSKYYKDKKENKIPLYISDNTLNEEQRNPHVIDSNSPELSSEDPFKKSDAKLSLNTYIENIKYYCKEENVDIFKYISIMAISVQRKQQNQSILREHEIALELDVDYAQYLRFRNRIRQGNTAYDKNLQESIKNFIKAAMEAELDIYELSLDKFPDNYSLV